MLNSWLLKCVSRKNYQLDIVLDVAGVASVKWFKVSFNHVLISKARSGGGRGVKDYGRFWIKLPVVYKSLVCNLLILFLWLFFSMRLVSNGELWKRIVTGIGLVYNSFILLTEMERTDRSQ